MRRMLRGVLLAAALFCCGMFLVQFLQGRTGEETYDAVAELAFRPDPQPAPPAEEPPEEEPPGEESPQLQWVPAPVEEEDPNVELLRDINLEALREVNPDVIGWIMIPDSKINYPLLQGTDNDYYLKHTWEGKKNIVGSIFLEHQNSPDLTDFNTIVYGHNMNNGSMFASLRKYSSEKYRQARPYVYLVSDQGVLRYEVFACYKAPVDSITYAVGFPQESAKTSFLRHARESAITQTGVIPEQTDRILTLSTCSGGGYTHRWVVQARLKMVQETVAP